MASTYEQLVQIRSQSVIAADILTRLESRGITSKGWTDADVRRGIVEVDADVKNSYEFKRADIVNSGFLDKAELGLLDLLGAGFFDETRLPASAATIQLDLIDTVGQGPYDVPAGAIAVVDGDTDTPLYYRLIAPVSVPQGGTRAGQWQATAPGAAHNILPNTPVKLATPIPGVELAATFVSGLSGVVVVDGVDAESDSSFRQRLKDKWSIIGAGWTDGAVRYWIRQVVPGASRIFVRDDAPATGEVWAYCAGPTSPISVTQAVAAAAYLKSKERKPVGNRPVRVMPAVPVIVPVTITLYTDGSSTALSTAAARLAAAQRDYTARTFPVSRIVDAIYAPEAGALNVKTNLTSDILLTPEQIIALAPTWIVELFS